MDTTVTRPARKHGLRKTLAAGLVLAAVAGAALPSASFANSSQVVNSYRVQVAKGILDNGSTVNAKAVITNGAAQQSDWWSQSTISKVVKTGVNRGYAKSYVSQGYRCNATVQAWNGTFTCKLVGADVPTTVKLTFKASWHH